MKIYTAIGHFKDSKNITSVVLEQNTKKDFMRDCYGNEFVPFVVLTESMLNKVLELDSMDAFEQVKKMTTNFRVWDDVTDYLFECSDIITDKVKTIKERA